MKEALFVSVIDFFTSIFTAVVVFSILGTLHITSFESIRLVNLISRTKPFPVKGLLCSSLHVHPNFTITFCKHTNVSEGAQWLSGRVLDSRRKGSGFEPHRRHCVVVLVQDTFILA